MESLILESWLNNTSNPAVKEAISCFLDAYQSSPGTLNQVDLQKCEKLSHLQDQMELVYQIIASSSQTPAALLEWLAKSKGQAIRLRVAENLATEACTLNYLAGDASPEVREAVAENPNTPEPTLYLLASDQCADVRYVIADNANIPTAILASLKADENPYVANRAKQTLKRLAQDSPSIDVEANQSTQNWQTSIVIVDDDYFIRALLKEQIGQDPLFTIAGEASNGLDGLDLVLRLKPDIVLMDIGLPMLNGVQTTQHIKAEAPEIKVLMVTGREEDSDITGALEAGADGYLLKTGSSENLITALKHLCRGHCWIDPGVTSTVLRHYLHNANVVKKTESKPPNHAITIVFEMAGKAMKDGRWDAARTLCETAIELSEAAGDESPEEISQLLAKLADCYYAHEDYDCSESLYLKSLELRQNLLDESDPNLDSYVTFLAKLYESAGNYEQAELYYSWSLRLREQNGSRNDIAEAQGRLNNIMAIRRES